MSSTLLDFSQAVAALYRLAQDCALDDFPGALTDLLRQQLDFDGAVLGFAEPLSFGDFSISAAHVHQRDPSIVDDYADISVQDWMTQRFLAGLSKPLVVDAEAGYATPEEAPVLEFTRRHRLRHLLLWGCPPQLDRAGRWLVLYRAADRPFETATADWLEAFWVHVDRAIALNREQALAQWSQASVRRASALVEASGRVVAADEAFVAWLKDRFGVEAAHRLPSALVEALSAGQSYEDVQDEIRFKAVGQYHVCELREAGPLSRLSPRERQVAQRFAAGASGKEIARDLGLSPYTVQSHLASIYRKLELSDKTALARLMTGGAY